MLVKPTRIENYRLHTLPTDDIIDEPGRIRDVDGWLTTCCDSHAG